MARFVVDGMEALEMTIEEIAKIPSSVKTEMLNAEADVIVAAQKSVGRQMGVHDTGQTLSSIKKGKAVITTDGGHIDVSPQGTRSGSKTRNAEVAFLNEYGTSRQKARPFMATANKQYGDRAISRAAQGDEKFLKSKGV